MLTKWILCDRKSEFADSNKLHTELSPTKRALLALEQMQAKLEALENRHHEPIAIIGTGCRFPGGVESPEQFWQLLRNGVDAIAPVPQDRWNIDEYYHPNPDIPGTICNRLGGFVGNLQDFDAQFFRISPREAASLDPQQRLLLEVSWEALENAGLAVDRLVGTQTGVFVGICANDYWHRLLSRQNTEIDAYLATGNSHSLAAGRISYSFGFTGPSLALDTACSSSLVAVHSACQSLRNQECNLAIAAGVNRILSPQMSINFSRAKMLSPEGRCKTFDQAADGFVRGEGCGVIVLKRLNDAIASNDNILAIIRGSAVNHDGRTSGLTVPNGRAQQTVIQQALENGRVKPEQVSYIETHGTGTPLGDPIEVNALNAVYGENRADHFPLIIASIKTNIGHLEAAAGMAGLIKVILALQHQEIPPHLHFNTPNSHIDWDKIAVKVPTVLLPWVRGNQDRIAGVSSFGFSGTNAHVILAEAPLLETKSITTEPTVNLLTLSAKTPTALQQLAVRYQNYLKNNKNHALADICFTANIGRSQFNHRLAIITRSKQELQQQFAEFCSGGTPEGLFQGRVRDNQVNHRFFPDLEFLPLQNDAKLLSNLAEFYVNGGSVNWEKFYQGYSGCKVVLPNYPFQRQQFWI